MEETAEEIRKRKNREKAKRWRDKNKEKTRRYYFDNREKKIEQVKKWNAENPEKVQQYRKKFARSQRIKNNIE